MGCFLVGDEVYVMLMMMRADESYTPAEGCTAEEMLACITADDYDACIAACEGTEEEEQDPEEVKAGTLNVTMKSEEGGDVPYGISALPVVTYTLKAADEDINITSLVLKEEGYGNNNTLDGVALFINGQRVSKVKNIDTDKDLTLNLSTAYTVKAGKSVDIEVRATVGNSLVAPETPGTQFAINLKDVNSSAEKVKLASNLTSNTFKVVNTAATNATITSKSAVSAPKAGAKNVDILEFSIQGNATQDMTLKNITFIGLGGGIKNTNPKDYADFLENLKLVLDGEVVATAEMNGKYLTFNLSKDVVIEKSKLETFTVKADIIGGAGETLDFVVEDAMDIVIEGNTYKAPVTIVEGGAGAGNLFIGANATAVANLPTHAAVSISAGKVTIERTNPSETTFVRNRNNLYLGSFTINNNGSSKLTLEGIDLEIYTNAAARATTYLGDIKVRYGSTSAGLVSLGVPALANWTIAAPDFVSTTDDTEVEIGSKLTVYVYADINNVALLDTDTFYIKLNGVTISENDSDEYLAAGDISYPARFLSMEAGSSDVTLTPVTLAPKSYSNGAENIEAVSFKVKTSTNAGVKVKTLVFDGSAYFTALAPISQSVLSAKLYVNDDPYDVTIGSTTITMKEPITLDADTTTTFTLKVNLESNPSISPFAFTLDASEVVAEDTTSDRNPISFGTTDIDGRTITVLGNGSVTLSYEANAANNKNAKSILAGTGLTVAEYNLYSTYEQARVKNIVLTLSNETTLAGNDIATSVNDIELYYGNTMIASSPVMGGTCSDASLTTRATCIGGSETWTPTATFANVNLTVLEEETPLTVKVISKAINADGGQTASAVTIEDVTLENVSGKTSGVTIVPVRTTTASNEFDIVPVTLVSSIPSEGKVKIVATRGSNTTPTNVAAKANLVKVTLSVSSNNAVDVITIKDTDGNVLGTVGTADTVLANGDKVITLDTDSVTAGNQPLVLGNGTEGTELTVEVSQKGSVYSPKYTVSLKGLEYTTNVDATALTDRATSVKDIFNVK